MSTPTPFDDALYSPQMGLAMGLLQGAGPSRMPVSLGQALGQGIQNAQQYGSQDWQRQLQLLRFSMAMQRLQQRRDQPASEQSSQAGGG